ncbi:MAG: A24 family peptidase [Pseudomonadota bacterium]|nr:A24 family peptidase [Pseudomonadota bacterium]
MYFISYFQTHSAAWIVLASVLGLVIGSFLNVVIHRLPTMLERSWRRECRELLGTATDAGAEPRFDLMFPGSTCPHCGHAIRAWENIPVLSYVGLRGRCSGCGQRISLRYPAVELSAGVFAAVTAFHFGAGVAAAAACALAWSLIALAFIDHDHQLLPDAITLPLLWAGLIVNSFHVFVPLHAAVAGAAAGYLSLWLVYHAFRLITGKEGMGHGDFKLFAALGAWFGWQELPLVILLASAVGALTGLGLIVLRGRDRAQPIPFGPYLCIAGWVGLLWGHTLTAYYLQFAHLGG